LQHPYQQVREAVATLVFFITRNAFRVTPSADGKSWAIRPNDAVDVFSRQVAARLQAAANKVETDRKEAKEANTSAVTEEQKQDQLFLETAMYWIIKCHKSGDSVFFVQVIPRLLPYILSAQKHHDTQCAAIAKYSSSLTAWVSAPPANISDTVQAVSSVSTFKSWWSRIAALNFLQIFVPRHSLLLTSAHVESAQKLAWDLLLDAQIEVRTQASSTLTAVLMCCKSSDEQSEKLKKRFVALAKTKVPKITAASTPAESAAASDATVKRHAGVLGLSAMVSSYPYSLPNVLPSLLAFLSDYVYEPLPISQGLFKLFAEFKRTHKDNWDEFQTKFTEEELEKVNGVVFTPSYIA